MDTTTRIADLPENIVHMPSSMGQGAGFEGNTYTPINVHPNPYGNSPPTAAPPPISHPQASPQRAVTFAPQTQEHRLPSRDIPMDTTNYSQDIETSPNYIPPVKLTSDYIREYENTSERRLKKHEREKYRKAAANDLFSEFQTPILISLLFFFFQLPIVSSFLYKNLSFLSVYNSDGNANFYGIFLKSALFGSIFWSIQRAMDYMN